MCGVCVWCVRDDYDYDDETEMEKEEKKEKWGGLEQEEQMK